MTSNIYLFTELCPYYLTNNNNFISNIYTPVFEIHYIWWHISMSGNFCYFSFKFTDNNIIGRIWLFPSFFYFNPFFIKFDYFLVSFWNSIFSGSTFDMYYAAYEWANFHDDDLIVVHLILDEWGVNLF